MNRSVNVRSSGQLPSYLGLGSSSGNLQEIINNFKNIISQLFVYIGQRDEEYKNIFTRGNLEIAVLKDNINTLELKNNNLERQIENLRGVLSNTEAQVDNYVQEYKNEILRLQRELKNCTTSASIYSRERDYEGDRQPRMTFLETPLAPTPLAVPTRIPGSRSQSIPFSTAPIINSERQREQEQERERERKQRQLQNQREPARLTTLPSASASGSATSTLGQTIRYPDISNVRLQSQSGPYSGTAYESYPSTHSQSQSQSQQTRRSSIIDNLSNISRFFTGD